MLCCNNAECEFDPQYGWSEEWMTDFIIRYDPYNEDYGHPWPEKLYNEIGEINKKNREYAKSNVFVRIIKNNKLKIIEPVPKDEFDEVPKKAQVYSYFDMLPKDVKNLVYSHFYKIGEDFYEYNKETEEILGTYDKTTTSTPEQYNIDGLYYTHIFNYNETEQKFFYSGNDTLLSCMDKHCWGDSCSISGGKKYKSKKNKKHYKNIKKSKKSKKKDKYR